MANSRLAIKNFGLNLRRGTVRLRRTISSSENRAILFLSLLGPGIIAASSGNEASGIATYSSAGAEYGYTLLWSFIPMTICFVIAQEMCVRMGVVTGQGLADLIREQFGVRWTALVMMALLIANAGIIIAEFIGIAQASELLGISRYLSVPITAVLLWWLVVKGTPKRVEQAFLLMSLVFFSYIVSAFMAGPDWLEVGKEVVRPTFSIETGYLFTVMALIGTTVTPFMQVFVQSSVVEKGLTKADYKMARADAVIGVILANLIAAFIMIATAATLHQQHASKIESAADAARALVPVVGVYAKYLFAIGLFGASMLAMGVLPLATAYSLTEALGFEKGLSHSFREAPIFLGIFTTLIVVGAAVALLPGVPQIQLLLFTQCINGLLLPVILVTIVLLSSNKEIMGDLANSRWFKAFAWFVTLTLSCLSILLILATVRQFIG
jgi:NRAMP (natural resistance-associated macrophage protein)-like metal ion transporter